MNTTNLVGLVCAIGLVVMSQTTTQAQNDTLFSNDKLEVRRYSGIVGIANFKRTQSPETLVTGRLGLYGTAKLTKSLTFRSDLVAHAQTNDAKWAALLTTVKWKVGNWEVLSGYDGSAMIRFRPYPLTLAGQAENMGTTTIPAGALTAHLAYNKGPFAIRTSATERGNSVGDSTEYAAKLDFGPVSIGGFYTVGGESANYGAAASIDTKYFSSTVFGSSDLVSTITTLKYKAWSINFDIIHNFETRSEGFYEMYTVYFFSNEKVSGIIGPAINMPELDPDQTQVKFYLAISFGWRDSPKP